MFLKLIRFKHWIKNFLIFIPLFFSFANNYDYDLFILVIIGFFAFSFLASSIYIINDIKDIELDKLHPIKKHRPLASGYYSKSFAVIISVLFIILSFCLLIAISYLYSRIENNSFNLLYLFKLFFILFLYLITNILYSFFLKHIPIIDIFILSLGFILRIYFGSSIISIDLSHWLYLTVMSGSFYLSLGKRRNEISIMEFKDKNQNQNQSQSVRKVLKYYTYQFLDKHMYMMLTIALIFYSLWCIDPLTFSKYNFEIISPTVTIPFLLLVVMKYNLNIENKNNSADPTDIILNDKVLLFLILLYGFILFSVLYQNQIKGFIYECL